MKYGKMKINPLVVAAGAIILAAGASGSASPGPGPGTSAWVPRWTIGQWVWYSSGDYTFNYYIDSVNIPQHIYVCTVQQVRRMPDGSYDIVILENQNIDGTYLDNGTAGLSY